MLRRITAEFPPGKQFSLTDLGRWKAWENAAGASVTGFGGSLTASRLTPIGWNRTIDEMEFMVTEVLCNELGLLASQKNHQYQLSPKGLLYLEGRRESVSSIGFCAMWFSPEVFPLWTQVIEPATRAAGYEPLRIDSKQHNGKIDDEIMASIRVSRFVVSDFTGNRGGVYYEAGFAHGLGLPVIFMCREGDELHFDIRQYNCIFWKPENLEDAQSQLKNRIVATLGQGPKFVQEPRRSRRAEQIQSNCSVQVSPIPSHGSGVDATAFVRRRNTARRYRSLALTSHDAHWPRGMAQNN